VNVTSAAIRMSRKQFLTKLVNDNRKLKGGHLSERCDK